MKEKKKLEKSEATVGDVLKEFMDKQFPRLSRKITQEEYDLFIRLTHLSGDSRHLVLHAIEAWNRIEDIRYGVGYDG